MGSQIDILLVGAGLFALACVMAFLITRPGRTGRAEMATLLSPIRDSPSGTAKTSSVHQTWPDSTLPDHSVFISYRREDSAETAGRLYEHLTSSLGIKAVYKDVDSNEPGGDFRSQLEQSLNACQVFLCVMGDRWAGPAADGRSIDNPEDFVRIEVETALRRDIPTIPVFVRRTNMPAPDFFPQSLRDLAYRQGLPLRPDPDFRNDMKQLISSVTAQLEKRQGRTAKHEIEPNWPP
jgi:TIR domain